MNDPIGRLAMRAEGDFWNAYFTKPDTMDGAVLIGSIALNAVVDNPERKDAFIVDDERDCHRNSGWLRLAIGMA